MSDYCTHAWVYGHTYVGCVKHCGLPQEPRVTPRPAPHKRPPPDAMTPPTPSAEDATPAAPSAGEGTNEVMATNPDGSVMDYVPPSAGDAATPCCSEWFTCQRPCSPRAARWKEAYQAENLTAREAVAEAKRQEHRADKFKWQVRDTCSRAEKAERQLAAVRVVVEAVKECGPMRHDSIVICNALAALAALTDGSGDK